MAPGGLSTEWDDEIPNQVHLLWNNVSNNESGFQIFRDGEMVGSVGADVTAWNDTLSDVSTEHTYTSQAYNSAGVSLPSNLASPKRAYTVNELVEVIWGETAGLRPLLTDDGHWRAESRAELLEGRKLLAHAAMDKAKRKGIYEGVYHRARTAQEQQNPDAITMWNDCLTAAQAVVEAQNQGADPTRGARHYRLRSGPITWSPNPNSGTWWQQKLPDWSKGPFRNQGGGDVPRDDVGQTYIDIYRGILD